MMIRSVGIVGFVSLFLAIGASLYLQFIPSKIQKRDGEPVIVSGWTIKIPDGTYIADSYNWYEGVMILTKKFVE